MVENGMIFGHVFVLFFLVCAQIDFDLVDIGSYGQLDVDKLSFTDFENFDTLPPLSDTSTVTKSSWILGVF